ncbi:AAA family ATPase [Glycomyces rhizosphaerae]|uniref:AAA family ATPase n=1 Tax=Glycomyces rhizosphaerae TaxID=2054422 RepID=A0ABV7Q588_9ACTN
MRIRSLSIRNVKAIPSLDIDFTRRVSLLHGANGIGKSTILDCIALLGHIATMDQVVIEGDSVRLRPPAVHAFLRSHPNLTESAAARMESIAASPPPRHEAIRAAVEARPSIDHWYDDQYVRTDRIRYVCDSDTTGSFTIIVAFTGSPGLTISHMLNRTRCDDLDMAEHLVVMFDGGELSVEEFLSFQSTTSTSLVAEPSAEPSGLRENFTAFHPTPAALEAEGHRVQAINTDLADLGKRDQIRESVKDLSLHFTDEVARLNLPFDQPVNTDGSRLRFRFFNELQTVISQVITDPAVRRGEGREPFLKLMSCDLINGQPQISFKRISDDESRTNDFMSAGENECFFIFLALLGVHNMNGVIILDEPELHIAEYCRPAFFEKLYALAEERNCQVIVATHSLFALSDREPVQFLVVGRTVERGGLVVYKCGENPEYSLSLFKAYWRIGTLFLSTAGSIRPFRSLGSAIYNSLSRLGNEKPIPMALLIGIVTTALGSLVNDLVGFLDLQTGTEHFVFIRLILIYGCFSAIGCAVLFWMRKRRTR